MRFGVADVRVRGKILEMFWAQWDSKGPLPDYNLHKKRKKAVFFAHSAFSQPEAAAVAAGARASNEELRTPFQQIPSFQRYRAKAI